MLETPEEQRRYERKRQIGLSRSTCEMLGWAVESLSINPPDSPQLRMIIYEGLTYVLSTVAKNLGEVYEQLNSN